MGFFRLTAASRVFIQQIVKIITFEETNFRFKFESIKVLTALSGILYSKVIL